jgi:hypothetical protein
MRKRLACRVLASWYAEIQGMRRVQSQQPFKAGGCFHTLSPNVSARGYFKSQYASSCSFKGLLCVCAAVACVTGTFTFVPPWTCDVVQAALNSLHETYIKVLKPRCNIAKLTQGEGTMMRYLTQPFHSEQVTQPLVSNLRLRNLLLHHVQGTLMR